MNGNDDSSEHHNSSSTSELAPRADSQEQRAELAADLDRARQELREAEAILASEQAAVNSFRMHCRLKLDAWIEKLTAVQVSKQSLYTRLQLMRQAQDLGLEYDEKDPFWKSEEILESIDEGHESHLEDNELILPTDTPRDKASEKRLYRKLVRKFHPDLGTSAVEIAYRTEMMSTVNIAHEQHDVQSLYDLAGELDPADVAAIAAIRNREIRDLNKQLLQCRRRHRRARIRLESLRSENTSRLWQKARHLDESGSDWWENVRREIERHIDRLRRDIDDLQGLIELLEEPA